MTKLEELKAAYAAEPYGLSDCDADVMPTSQVRFYDAAHELMPTLLEAVELLQECHNGGECRGAEHRVKVVLEKLK